MLHLDILLLPLQALLQRGIKGKTPPLQYRLYQPCAFSSLIPPDANASVAKQKVVERES